MELEEIKKERKYCGRLGWALVAVILCTLVWSSMLSAATDLLMTYIVTDDKLTNLILGSIVAEMLGLLGMAGHYIIGLPVAWWICRSVPRAQLEKDLIGVRRSGRWFVIGVSLMHIGAIVGSWLNGLALQLTGRDPINFVDEMIGYYPQTAAVIGTCVLAPICEELLFRGLLANRLARYGQMPAALVSALLFGLYHANLEQFFYAFALGILLAYAYFRSGRLIVPIALHMLLNIYGSGALFWIGDSEFQLLLYGISILILSVMGVVMMVRRRNEQEWAPGICPASAGIIFGNAGMVFAIAVTAVMFILNFIMM